MNSVLSKTNVLSFINDIQAPYVYYHNTIESTLSIFINIWLDQCLITQELWPGLI